MPKLYISLKSIAALFKVTKIKFSYMTNTNIQPLFSKTMFLNVKKMLKLSYVYFKIIY